MHPQFLEIPCSKAALRRTAVAVAVSIATFQAEASPQYFGQNKVQHEHLDFAIIQTEHFDVYYYQDEREAAVDGARMAERAYDRFSRLLNHEYRQRQPLILYASHSEFQQNNLALDDASRFPCARTTRLASLGR